MSDGTTIAALGLGSYGMPQSDMQRMFPGALDAGFRHFDTHKGNGRASVIGTLPNMGMFGVLEGELVLVTSCGQEVLGDVKFGGGGG